MKDDRLAMLIPIKIDNRINGFLGKLAGGGRRPVVIHQTDHYDLVTYSVHQERSF